MNESTGSIQKEPIIVETALSKREYIKLLLTLACKTWGMYFLVAIMAGVTILSFALNDPLLLLLWIVFGLYMALLVGIALYQAHSSLNWTVFVPVRYTFSDAGFESTSTIAQCTATWEAVVGWKCAAGFYNLFHSSSTFWPIPRAAIPDDQMEQFEALLSSKVKRR